MAKLCTRVAAAVDIDMGSQQSMHAHHAALAAQATTEKHNVSYNPQALHCKQPLAATVAGS